jgi:hypothetical protein
LYHLNAHRKPTVQPVLNLQYYPIISTARQQLHRIFPTIVSMRPRLFPFPPESDSQSIAPPPNAIIPLPNFSDNSKEFLRQRHLEVVNPPYLYVNGD